MIVYLGTHRPAWLKRLSVPMMQQHRNLAEMKSMPRALGPWVLDSGGFTELTTHGSWEHGPTPAQYAKNARRFHDEIGNLEWCAIQDWMCEPEVIAGRPAHGWVRKAWPGTHLSVEKHQELTVRSYEDLLNLDWQVPWLPVLQGWVLDDYLRCVDLYASRGFDLTELATVGIGSVCRRHKTEEATEIVETLTSMGLSLHGFGFKSDGVRQCQQWLASSDSLAWSAEARWDAAHNIPAWCDCGHQSQQNCPQYALRWYDKLIGSLDADPSVKGVEVFPSIGGVT